MKIRIHSELTPLVSTLSERLTQRGFDAPEVISERTWRYEICHGVKLSTQDVEREVRDGIAPFAPPVKADLSLEGDEVRIYIGDSQPMSMWDISVISEAGWLSERVERSVSPLGLQVKQKFGNPKESTLKYGGASALIRHTLAWACARYGITLTEENVWSDEEVELILYLPEPTHRGPIMRRLTPVVVLCDDADRGDQIASALRECGYMQAQAHITAHLESPSFILEKGVFDNDLQEGDRLKSLTENIIASKGVDSGRYPLLSPKELDVSAPSRWQSLATSLELEIFDPQALELSDIERTLSRYSPSPSPAYIVAPMDAYARGQVTPARGTSLSRWKIELLGEDVSEHRERISALRALGVSEVTLSPLTLERAETLLDGHIEWGSASAHPQVYEEVLKVLGPHDYLSHDPMNLFDGDGDDEGMNTIVISLTAHRDGSPIWLSRLHALSALTTVTLCMDGGDLTPLARALYASPFKELDVIDYTGHIPFGFPHWDPPLHQSVTEEERPSLEEMEIKPLRFPSINKSVEDSTQDGDYPLLTQARDEIQKKPIIRYGGAPTALIQWLAVRVQSSCGVAPDFDHCWKIDDLEILIEVPPSFEALAVATSSESDALSWETWFSFGPRLAKVLPLISSEETGLWIADTFLPYHHDEAPSPDPRRSADALCLDEESAYALYGIAESISLNEPILIEGAPGRAKRAMITLLAQLTHASTYTHVLSPDVPIDIAQMINDRPTIDWLILDATPSSTTGQLSQALSQWENMTRSTDGRSLQIFALCEPLNRGEISALSARDRAYWTGYRSLDSRSRIAYEELLTYWIFGEAPEVTLRGEVYQGPISQEPIFAGLSTLHNVRLLISALAQFHHSLERALSPISAEHLESLDPMYDQSIELSGLQREVDGLPWDLSLIVAHEPSPPELTAKTLRALLGYLNSKINAPQARSRLSLKGQSQEERNIRWIRAGLMRYYIDPISSGRLRALVAQLLDLAGIGLTTWTV